MLLKLRIWWAGVQMRRVRDDYFHGKSDMQHMCQAMTKLHRLVQEQARRKKCAAQAASAKKRK